MTKLVRVANVDDIPAGEPLGVEIEGERYALIKNGDEVFCVQDVCTHEYALLSEGFCEAYEIECPLHGSIFDVRNGEVKSLPATEDLKTFAVTVDNGEISIDVES